MIEKIMTDISAHISFGVALSLLDYITYKIATPKEKRIEQKVRCLRSIEIILDTENSEETVADSSLSLEDTADLKSEPVDDLKSEPPADLKPEPTADLKPELNTDSSLRTEPAAALKPELNTDSSLRTEPTAELKSEPVAALKPEPTADLKSELNADSGLRPEPAAELKSELNADSSLRTEAAADLKSELNADSGLRPDPPADLKSEATADLKSGETADILPTPLQKNSALYRANIAEVFDYLRKTELIELDLSFLETVKNSFRSILFNEKLNVMTNLQKFGLSLLIEILYDILIEFRYYAIEGIAKTLYQVPALFIGLWLGNIIKKITDLLIISSEESELDDTIRSLMEETPIADIVINDALSILEKNESELILTGKDLYQHALSAAEAAKKAAKKAAKYKKLQKEKEKRKREARRKRFNSMTKGR